MSKKPLTAKEVFADLKDLLETGEDYKIEVLVEGGTTTSSIYDVQIDDFQKLIRLTGD